MLRIAGWVALAAVVVVAAGVLLPVSPDFLTGTLDAGFGATLHVAAANGGAGAPLISTFGPLGFVFYPTYFPSTFAWLFALRAALAVATCWALAWIGSVGWKSPWGAVVALLGCVSFLASPDVWLLTVALLPALIELAPRPAPAPLRWVLGAAVGLVSMIKFTALVIAAATLLPLAAAAMWERRRVPALVGAALTAAALAWVGSGRGAADWLAYLDWSIREISAGYSSAMQLMPDRQLVLQAAAVSAAVLVAGALLGWWRRRWACWPIVLGLTTGVYVLFKEGFVRADVHVLVTCYGLLVLSVLLALLWGPQPWRVVVAAALIGLLPGRLWLHTEASVGPRMYFGAIFPRQAIERLRAAPNALRRATLDAAYAHSLATVRGGLPLPPVAGAIDSYSYDQSLLIAYGADFRPRPVFQSYMAYSPRLAHANAAVLLGDRAPQWILFRDAPLDGALPTLDDPPSWPLLLTRYRVAQDLGQFVLLQRRPTPLAWHLEPIAHLTAATDTTIAVPPADGALIWARIDLHETPRDALVRTLLAAPLVFVDAVVGQQTFHYRLVPALARDGFLLSPLVRTTADFVRLATQPYDSLEAQAVTALRVQIRPALGIVPGPRALEVEFLRLVIEPDPGEPAAAQHSS